MISEEMGIDWVVKQAKDILVQTGKHLPQVIAEMDVDNKKELAMIVMPFSGEKEKENAIEALRAFVINKNVDRYWFVTEGWSTKVEMGKKLWRPASRDVERKEILIVSEFNKDMTQKCIMIPFRRDDNNIIIFDNEVISKDSSSIWNVYLEKEGTNERHNKFVEDTNDAFLRRMAKDMSKKYFDKVKNAKSDDERVALIGQMVREGKKQIFDQKKTILENVDEDDRTQ